MKIRTFKQAVPWVSVSVALMLMSFTFIKNARSHKHLNLERFTSEQLFRGIFFNQGDIAASLACKQDALTAMSHLSEGAKKQSAVLADEVITSIRQQDPGFLDAFRDKVVSRDYSNISDALTEGSKAVKEALIRVMASHLPVGAPALQSVAGKSAATSGSNYYRFDFVWDFYRFRYDFEFNLDFAWAYYDIVPIGPVYNSVAKLSAFGKEKLVAEIANS